MSVPVSPTPEPRREVALHIDADLITNMEGDQRALRRTIKAAREAMAARTCHCGQPAVHTEEDDDGRLDGYCDHCTWTRCDAFPGACNPSPVSSPTPDEQAAEEAAERYRAKVNAGAEDARAVVRTWLRRHDYAADPSWQIANLMSDLRAAFGRSACGCGRRCAWCGAGGGKFAPEESALEQEKP